MRPRILLLSLAAGTAAFLVVGVVVTELAAPAIEFSLFLGIPAGLVAGVGTAAFVYARLGDPAPARRRPALALAGFGVAFLIALLAGVAAGLRNSVALPVAVGFGVLVAAGTYVRLRSPADAPGG